MCNHVQLYIYIQKIKVVTLQRITAVEHFNVYHISEKISKDNDDSFKRKSMTPSSQATRKPALK